MNRRGRLERRTPLAPGGPLPRTPFRTRTTELHRTPARPKPKTRRGEFTPTTRVLLWDRFGGRCPCHGLPLPLFGWEAQHRRARQMGGSHLADTPSPANGLALPKPCHAWVEAHPVGALAAGWWVPQGVDPATVSVLLWTGHRVWLDHEGGYSENPTDFTEETRAA